MKTFAVLILLILALVHSQTQDDRAQPGRMFECVVTSVKDNVISIACDVPNNSLDCKLPKNVKDPVCVNTYLDIPVANWNEFAAWQTAPMKSYADIPRKQPLPQVKQILMGKVTENGNFDPVPSCEERAHVAVQEYCRANDYCRHPLALLTPHGCGGPHSGFIAGLLR